MKTRENGRGTTTDDATDWPEGVQVTETKMTRSIVTVTLTLGEGRALKCHLSKNSQGEVEVVHLGVAAPDGAVPPARQLGPIPGPHFEQFLDVMDRVLEPEKEEPSRIEVDPATGALEL